MKTLTPQILYSAEWKSTWTNNACKTADDVWNILATSNLKMPSRNLNYTEVWNNLIQKLKEYVERAWVESMVMWVSGWVDSWLVSTLAAETGIRLIVIEMPIHQDENEVNRAQNHIAWLKENYPNVESMKVDLTETFETMKAALPEIENEEIIRYMAYVNTRSRLRGNILYAVANEHNGIVLGTWNRVEDYGIGFFTKFGDGAVDVSPIGNLYKSEVRELARRLWVQEEISEAVATDGLHSTWATDEDQIGCSYDELEWAMVEYDSWKRTSNFSGRAHEVMKIYTARHEGNAHKMEMPPVFEIEV